MYPLFSNVPFLFPLRLLEKQTLTDFDSFFHHCNTYLIHHFSWSHLLFVTGILTEFHYCLQNSDWKKRKIDGFQLFLSSLQQLSHISFNWSHLLFVTGILTEFHYCLQNSDWKKGKIDGFQLFLSSLQQLSHTSTYIILAEVNCFL